MNASRDILQAGSRQPVQPEMNPGDDAVEGTPGTGEDVCAICEGNGLIGNTPCDNCGGTGRVIEGIGGG